MMTLFCMVLLLLSQTTISAEEEIQQMITQKEMAVQQRDWLKYQQTLAKDHTFYIQEKKRWFQDVIRYVEPGSFRLKIQSLNRKEEDLYEIWVEQAYQKQGKKVTVSYPLRVKKTDDGWKDVDLPFQSVGVGKVRVYFSHPDLKKEARVTLETIQLAKRKLEQRFAWTPKRIEVKLYHQPAWFWLSVKPSLPRWAIGWHEADQSIKLVGGVMDLPQLKASIVHELVHQMVSELTNDNAAYWLQEGTASYFEKHLLSQDEEFIRKTPSFSLSDLEQVHLESLPIREAAKYYESCYLLVGFIVQEYKEEALRRLFRNLAKENYIDLESDQKLSVTTSRTRKSLQKSLAISSKQLDEKWLQDRQLAPISSYED